MKKVIALLLAATLAIGMMACGAKEEAPAAAPEAEAEVEEEAPAAEEEAGAYKIGCVGNMSGAVVTATMMNAMVAKAEAMGAEPTLVYYEESLEKMVSIIEDMTNTGYDAICFMMRNANDAEEALNAAHEKGIALVAFDAIPEGAYDVSFTADNLTLGYKIGEAAVKWGEENLIANGIDPVIGVINWPESEFLLAREQGILNAMEELWPEYPVVMKGAATTEPDGLTCGENFLTAYPDMNIVCTINDDGAAGCLNAFKAAGIGGEDEPRGIFSCDGTEVGLRNVMEDSIHRCDIDLSLPIVCENMVVAAIQTLEGNCEYEKDEYFPMEPVWKDQAAEALKNWGVEA